MRIRWRSPNYRTASDPKVKMPTLLQGVEASLQRRQLQQLLDHTQLDIWTAPSNVHWNAICREIFDLAQATVILGVAIGVAWLAGASVACQH